MIFHQILTRSLQNQTQSSNHKQNMTTVFIFELLLFINDSISYNFNASCEDLSKLSFEWHIFFSTFMIKIHCDDDYGWKIQIINMRLLNNNTFTDMIDHKDGKVSFLLFMLTFVPFIGRHFMLHLLLYNVL
jgi:hypothetical protein